MCASLAGQADTIVEIAEQMTKAFRQGKKVLLFGNGGSAADAEHIACELAGKFTLFRDPLPAVALTTNTSSLTAIGNDFGYEEVFARQLRGLVAKGDVVIGLSTSGASPNVIKAIEEANRQGAITVAFTGAKGKLKESAQHGALDPLDRHPSNTGGPYARRPHHLRSGRAIAVLPGQTAGAAGPRSARRNADGTR